MPIELRVYIISFNKNSFQLRRQIFQPHEEYEAGSLKKEHSEAWYMAHVWHFVDTLFNSEDEITVLRRETSSRTTRKKEDIATALFKATQFFEEYQS
ncbi:MAG: hypothetical protein EXX96DRAFT_621015 [Benjaminiella poitrasii]|nr:MAG: hypothetical protein EXX96DRAFT_621015 [Benjaminiella poitrasii]